MNKHLIRTASILAVAAILAYSAYAFMSRPEKAGSGNSDGETIIIKWMVFGDKYKASDYVFSQFNEELQKYFEDTVVEFEVVSKDAYKEKWDMKMAANETVDLAWMGSDLFNFTEEVKKGSLMALQYLLESHGKDLLEEIDDDLWSLQESEGNTYGIPVPGALYQKNLTLVVSKTLIDRYGDADTIGEINRNNLYTTRECYESFEPFLEKVMEKGAIGTGVSYLTFSDIADKGYEGIYGIDSPFIIKIYDDEWKVYNKYELADYCTYFEKMAEWYGKGYIRSDIADALNPLSDDGKTNGSIFFIDEYGENGTAPEMVQTEYEEVRIELESMRYIAYAGNRNSIVIPKSSENPQRALEIINFLYTDEGQELYRLLVNGIEKEHYIEVDDDRIARMSDNSGNYLYQLSPYTIGNIYQNYELAAGEFKQLQKYNSEAMRSPLIGFDLDTRMIAIEMAKVELVVEAYKDILCQGTAENWQQVYEEFTAKMKEAGSEKIIQEMQRQIDQFLEK